MSQDLNTISTELNYATTDIFNSLNNIFLNPLLIIILVIVIIIYITIFMSLGDSDTTVKSLETTNNGTNVFTILVVILFIFLILINGLQYFFSIDVIAKIKNMFSQTPEIDIVVDNNKKDIKLFGSEEQDNDNNKDNDNNNDDNNKDNDESDGLIMKKQVFNIPENNYNYEDAKALCKAYGSRLASYSELEEAYKSGGEWCNYGWSKDQMALFPTQESTWKKLQTKEGHKNDCGRPGVNGGYIANPNIKYGVNCYGYKPKMSIKEEELMATMPIYPKTKKDIEMENRVKYWKDKLKEIVVSPFNHNSWSKI